MNASCINPRLPLLFVTQEKEQGKTPNDAFSDLMDLVAASSILQPRPFWLLIE
jgi:hypothetical protein